MIQSHLQSLLADVLGHSSGYTTQQHRSKMLHLHIFSATPSHDHILQQLVQCPESFLRFSLVLSFYCFLTGVSRNSTFTSHYFVCAISPINYPFTLLWYWMYNPSRQPLHWAKLNAFALCFKDQLSFNRVCYLGFVRSLLVPTVFFLSQLCHFPRMITVLLPCIFLRKSWGHLFSNEHPTFWNGHCWVKPLVLHDTTDQ